MKLHASLMTVAMALEASSPARAESPGSYQIPAFAGQFVGQASGPAEPLLLWYRRPAVEWEQALPVGNGRLGGMVFGALLKNTLPSMKTRCGVGGPYRSNQFRGVGGAAPGARADFRGQVPRGAPARGGEMMARPLWQAAYQPVGSLLLAFPELAAVENYRRELDLDTAIARVSYRANGTSFTARFSRARSIR